MKWKIENKEELSFATGPSVVCEFIFDPLEGAGAVGTVDQVIKFLDYVQSQETICCSISTENYVIWDKRSKHKGQIWRGLMVIQLVEEAI